MAYNSTIDKATDDILIYGNTVKDGSGTSYVPLLDADGQLQVDVLSNALPTGASTLAEQQSQTTHLSTIAGDTTSIQTAVELLDDTVATDGAATPTKGILMAGQDGTNAQTLKTDASGELQVDVLTMPTTTVTATDLDIRNLVNTDVVTAELSAVDNAVLDAIAASVAAIDTDATTIIGHVDGLEASNTAIQAAVEILDNAISGTEMQVDVVAALPAGTNAIGKLAANTGVDIGDVDVTSVVPGTGATNLGKAEDAGHTTGDVGVFNLGVRVDTPNTALTNTDADYSPITTNKLGSLRTATPEDDLATAATNHVKKYYTNAGAVTDGIVWSPAAGKRWFVTDIFIGVSAACTVTLEDDLTAGDAAVFKMEFAANSGWSHTFATPWFSGEDAADLLVTTTAGNVYITITGYEI